MLQVNELRDRLRKIINFESMSDTQIYNFVIDELKSHESASEFMVNELGYQRYQVNRILYRKKYEKLRYRKKLQINSANNI